MIAYMPKMRHVCATRDPEGNPYIQSAKLDGSSHNKGWIKFGDICAGGTLQFDPGPNSNKSCGSAADEPPSLSEAKP